MERIRGGWSNVPGHLTSKTDLKNMGLRPTGEPQAEVWNSYIWVPLYNKSETVRRRSATPKQLDALARAREAQIRARTCVSCGDVVSRKEDLLNGVCSHCTTLAFIRVCEQEALERFIAWFNSPNEYLILDTETTGAGAGSEIVEIAVVDLNENVLFESLVRPTRPIPEEATSIHGITNEMVEDAATWPEAWEGVSKAIDGFTILTYNAGFDTDMIKSSCEAYEIAVPRRIPAECIMETYARYIGNYSSHFKDFRWVSLSEACRGEEVSSAGLGRSHRALTDCTLKARLIRSIASEALNNQNASGSL